MITLAFGWSNIGTILLFVLIICVLIAWHELGHLFMAKKFNVYCYEYAIGFGPLIFKKRKKETQFSIRAIPLGGFVKMAGEEGLEEGEVLQDNDGNPLPSERVLSNRPLGQKALVLAAGGIMNLILALVCFYFFVSFNQLGDGRRGFITPVRGNEVSIAKSSQLASQGMETGDKIIKIQTKLKDESEFVSKDITKFSQIQDMLDLKKPKEDSDQVQEIVITFEDVSENNAVKEAKAERSYEEVDGKKSLKMIGLGQNFNVYEYNAFTGLYGAWHFMGYYTVEIGRAFGELFTGNFKNLSGLVGIYEVIDETATNPEVAGSMRFLQIIYITGAISFSLGFFNLIPFPALDGGRLVFVAIEAITKKKVKPNVEATIHSVGILILFALMILINIRDVINIFK